MDSLLAIVKNTDLSLALLFARTFALGVAIAVPVSAMGKLAIQRTFERGWLTGIATGFGIATADGVYAALAAFGVAIVSATLVTWHTPLRLVGGAGLAVLGARVLLSDSLHGEWNLPVSPRGSAYVSAVGLTLLHPLTIAAFGAAFVCTGLVAQPGIVAAVTATAGIFVGSLVWWIVLITSVAVARKAAEKRHVQRLSVVSGIVIAGFGLYTVGDAVLTLLG